MWPLRECKNYIEKQIDAIRTDDVLRHYGVAMALTHVLSAFWWFEFGVSKIVQRGSENICWPFLTECSTLRIFTARQFEIIFYFYGFVAIVVAGLFLSKRHVALAYIGLIIINIAKLSIIFIDFRLRLNQHYMALVVTLVFLLVPHKRTTIPWIIALIYFWSGIIKLNWGWISGDALLGRLPFFSGIYLEAACVYVLVLELVLVWGLFAKGRVIFWSCFVQFLIFHLISWWVVGFFYPLLMFAILSFFIIEFVQKNLERPHAMLPVSIMTIIFSLLQMFPYLIPGDHTITGEGRFLSLHMFDAPHRCEILAFLKTPDKRRIQKNFRINTTYRIACDPLVYYHRARGLCQNRQRSPIAFTDFDLVILEGEDRKALVSIENFCSQNIVYSAFKHNQWIALY